MGKKLITFIFFMSFLICNHRAMAFNATLPNKIGEEKLKKIAINLLLNAEEYREKGDCAEALNFYRSYLQISLNSTDMVWNNYGFCLYETGKIKKALKAFKVAYLKNPKPVYLFNQAICLIKLKRNQKACEILKKIFSKYPNFLESNKKRLLLNFCKTYQISNSKNLSLKKK